MNFPNYYSVINRRDLMSKSFELYMKKPDGCGVPEDINSDLNDFGELYGILLLGVDNRFTRLRKFLKRFLDKPKVASRIYHIHQRVLFAYYMILERGLFEMLPQMEKINREIASIIVDINPNMNVDPLLSEDNLLLYEAELDAITSENNKKSLKH